LLLTLPILLTLLFGMIEVSQFLVARQQLVVAGREGARVSALGGGRQEVQQAVMQFLGAGSLSGSGLQILLTDETGQTIPSGDPVEVDLSLPAAQAVPDLLGFVGFSLKDKYIVVRTIMKKE
jgi:Flp pilus assembly protein TadG